MELNNLTILKYFYMKFKCAHNDVSLFTYEIVVIKKFGLLTEVYQGYPILQPSRQTYVRENA